MWWLHKKQQRSNGGRWSSYGSYYASPTASAIQAFEINGHLQDGDHQENPYVETVGTGLDYMFTKLRSDAVSMQTYGNPDTNGNGIGLSVNSDRSIYETGMVMDAIASSNAPLAFARTGGDHIQGRFFHQILTDMVDMYAWGQYDSSSVGGGWRYSWNQHPDNSACQWAAIGMLAAEDNFGINVPQFVKDRNSVWLTYSWNGTGFGYTNSGNGKATTPSGLVQLAFDDRTTNDVRWQTAEDYIANNWFWQNNNYYAAYSLVKALKLAQPEPVELLSATGLDWYNDTDTGIRKRIVDQQGISGGNWGSWDSSGYGGRGLDTAWAVIMLTPTLFVRPPVADAGDDIIWAYGTQIDFHASGSFHKDPVRTIVKYEWDFEGDGTWDLETTDPENSRAVFTYPDPNPNVSGDPPQVYTARLRVTDDNNPAQTDIDTRTLTVTEPPHAPFADPGGPYIVTVGIPFSLNGSASHDLDPGDSITQYHWDLDNDGQWFNDIDMETGQSQVQYTFNSAGTYNIGLKVWDNGAFNPTTCTVGVDCMPMASKPAYTTVIVEPNLSPIADAGGPYTIDEGTSLVLDGSRSDDPNGNAVTWAWDLDNDGEYNDSSQAQPARTWEDNGTYTVSLKVLDSLLSDTDDAAITVLDRSPTADFSWTPEPQEEGSMVHFMDRSVSFPDAIVNWSWDLAGTGTSCEQNPETTFNDNGVYTVTLTITDDDGSNDSVSRQITIADRTPVARLTGDTVLAPGREGTFDAAGSTSSPDAITGFEWDWNYDGNTFNPSGDSGALQTHTWDQSGTWRVAVRVTDDDGSRSIAGITVLVEAGGPTADAGEDQQLSKNLTLARENIQLNGTGSFDPDGDSLMYQWFGPFGTTTGQTPLVTVPEGHYTVSLMVNDGVERSAPDTVDIHIEPCFDIAARAKSGKIQLTWTHIEGTERYDVYRAHESNPFTFEKIAETVSTYATYLDGTVINETTYLYIVGALSQGQWCFSNVVASHPTSLRSRTPVNYSPLLYSFPIDHGTAGIFYTYDVNVADANGDELIYELVQAPAALTIDAQTGRITWPAPETGTYEVIVSAADPQGAEDQQAFTLVIEELPAVNQPPVIVSTPVETATEDDPYTYDVEAQDPDPGDVLTFALLAGPSGMAIDSNTGLIEWTPVQEHVGDQTVTITATDPQGAMDEQSFLIKVTNVNDTPVITPIDDRSVLGGNALAVQVSAIDQDGDTIAITAADLPNFAALTDYGDGTALLSFEPALNHAGQYSIEVQANDGTATGTESFVLTVVNLNQPPVITSTPAYQVKEDDAYTYTAVAQDPDGDKLVYSLGTAPADMTIDADTGVIAWQPGNDQVGQHDVILRATDNGGLFDEQSFTLTVNNVNDSPVLQPIADQEMDENQTLTLQVSATDPDAGDVLVISFMGLPAFAAFTATGNGTGDLTFTPDFNDAGEYSIIIHANDGEVTHSIMFTLTVRPVNRNPVADTGGPYINIVDTPLTFAGNLSQDPDGDSITLSWDFGDTTDPADGVQPVHTYSAVGTYTVTLTVTDDQGASDTAQTQVTIHATPLVDLEPADMDTTGVTIDPQTMKISGTVDVVITNNGDTDVFSAYALTVFEDVNVNQTFDPGIDEVLGRTDAPESPEAGRTMTVHVDVGGQAEFADNLLYVMVDSAGEIDETDEGNNVTHSMAACEYHPPVGQFDPVVEWIWNSSNIQSNALNIMMTPVIIDLNADDIPDVVFASTASTGGGLVETGILRALAGGSGSELFSITDSSLNINTVASIAAGDIDQDGLPEIIACDASGSRLIAFENDGTYKWRSPVLEPVNWGAVALSDVDADGTVEIIIGRQVLNSDGTIRWTGSAGRGSTINWESIIGPLSFPIDLNGDGRQEILAGNTAYTFAGNILWHSSSLPDGYNAVGNFDLDLFPEIVLVSGGQVWLLENDGSIKWGPVSIPGGGNGGPPTVADFDNDGAVEIGVAGANRYAVFDTDGSILWQSATQDGSSARTGSSVFDFDGDGSSEVVYRDELKLRIYKGTDGAILFETPMSSCTGHEYVQVADVDNDGNAEIVAVANNSCGYGSQRGVYVFGDANDTWTNTRKIWNQHAYSITNVNDDGTIPQHPANNWETFNNFRCNQSSDALACVDLSTSYLRLDPAELPDSYDIIARIGNAGALHVVPGTDIAFYEGDPDNGGTLLGITQVSGQLNPGEYEDVRFTISQPVEGEIEIFVRTDDDGTGIGAIREVDEDNNTVGTVFDITLPNPPEITSTPVTSAATGEVYTYDVEAVDPNDGDVLTFFLDEAPAGMAIDSDTGEITWTPDRSRVGSFDVAVRVMDLTRATATQAYVIDVTDGGNHGPAITSTPVKQVGEYQDYTYQLTAVDPDGDEVSYALIDAPEGMIISEDGRISWPEIAQRVSPADVTVQATDSFGEEARQTWAIAIVDYVPPALQVTAAPEWLGVNDSVHLTAMAPDMSVFESLTLTINNETVELTNSQADYICPAPGIYTAEAHGVDIYGYDVSATVRFFVRDPDDNEPPNVTIHSPDTGSLITSPTQIIGTVDDPEDELAYYKVEAALVTTVNLASLHSSHYKELYRGTGEVRNDALGTFDTTQLKNDEYVIRVTAYDASGNSRQEGIRLNVTGNLKLGNFRLEFTDLSIPLAGIPIQVNRIYDTLQANEQGDFGYGWTLGAYDADIRETIPEDGPCLMGSCAPIKVGSRVYLNTPDGRRVGFTFEPKPGPCGLFGCTYYPRFKADPGVYETLETPESNGNAISITSDGSAVIAMFGFAYNPDTYILTLKNGLEYTYNQRSGLQNITDRNGNQVTFSEDGITHSSGVAIDFVRDSQDRITQLVDPAGNAVVYGYNTAGDLVSVTDQEDNTTTFTYYNDPAHYLDEIFDSLGRRPVKSIYDDNGKLIATIDAEGNRVEQDFNIGDFTGTFTDARGNITHYDYDERGNLLRETNPLGGVKQYEYGDPNNPDKETRIVDENKNATAFTYDPRGNMLTKTDALDNTAEWTYNSRNQVLTYKDVIGRQTQYIYDDNGNQIETIDPAGVSTYQTFDDQGRRLTRKDAKGNVTTYTYSGYCCGSPETITNPDGGVETFEYNHLGLKTKHKNQLGQTTEYFYDNVGRVSSIKNDNETFFEWDGTNLTDIIDSLGRHSKGQYNGRGKVVKNVNNAGKETVYTYDDNDNLLSLTDPEGNTTRFEYDIQNRRDRQIDPLGHISLFSYDDVGNVIEFTDRNGKKRTFERDELNRMTKEIWWDGNMVIREIVFEYDDAGRLVFASDPDSSYTFTYHPHYDRLVSVNNAGTPNMPEVTLTYSYDTNGNTIDITDSMGVSVASSYNNMNRLEARTWTDNTTGLAQVKYSYDKMSQVKTLERMAYQDATTSIVTMSRYHYDDAGRLTGINHLDSNNQPLVEYGYGFDKTGQITSMEHHGESFTYSYDPVGQLTDTDRSIGEDEFYTYDSNGNRTSSYLHGVGYFTGVGNQLLTDGEFNYIYDDEGNLIEQQEITTGEIFTYIYDYRNRMTEVMKRTADNSIVMRVQFFYDVFNRRIAKMTDTEDQFTYYNGENAWVDFDSTGNVQTRYFFGDNIDDIIARNRLDEGTIWYHKDHLGTIRDLCNASSDIIAHIDYNSFGIPVILNSDKSIVDRFLYTGREYDQETGHYYYRSRYYNPVCGRFTTQDPIGFSSMDANLYRFVGNSPINFIDPSGTTMVGYVTAVKIGQRLGGAIVGFASGFSQNTFTFLGDFFKELNNDGNVLLAIRLANIKIWDNVEQSVANQFIGLIKDPITQCMANIASDQVYAQRDPFITIHGCISGAVHQYAALHPRAGICVSDALSCFKIGQTIGLITGAIWISHTLGQPLWDF